MDEEHLIAAIRYVSLNPVRARLFERAEDWPWPSVRAHRAGRDDGCDGCLQCWNALAGLPSLPTSSAAWRAGYYPLGTKGNFWRKRTEACFGTAATREKTNILYFSIICCRQYPNGSDW